MQKLLIADASEEFRMSAALVLQKHFQILQCSNGIQALQLIRQERPDLVLLDVMLPELDGLTLLETAAAEVIPLRVLVVTAMTTDYLLQSAARLGIGYVMRKPCDLRAVVARTLDLAQGVSGSGNRLDTMLPELLLFHHISPRHNGYDYMRAAIVRMIKEPDISTTKALYPAIARQFGCKPGHVERSIRSALDAAWNRSAPEIWQKYFPGTTRRPSNTVFISRMAELLRPFAE